GAGRVDGPGHQPEGLPVGLLDAVAAAAITSADLVVVQMRGDGQSGAGHGATLRRWCRTDHNDSLPGDSVSPGPGGTTRSVEDGIPTRSVGTRGDEDRGR